MRPARLDRTVAVCAIGAASTAGWIASTQSLWIQIGTGVLAAGVGIIAVTQTGLCAAVLFLMLFASTHADVVSSNAGIADLVRVAAWLLAGGVFLRVRRRVSRDTRLLSITVGLALIAHGFAGLNGFSQELATAMAALALSYLSIVALVTSIPRRDILSATVFTLILLCGASLLYTLVQPADALEGRRLEGLFRNSNTLGFFAAIGLALSMAGTSIPHRWILLSISAPTLAWSGSRSALVGLLVALAIVSLRVFSDRSSRRTMRTAAGALLLCAVIVSYVGVENLLIFRTNNSRLDGFSYAWPIVQANPLTGIGFETSSVEVASTPLRWFLNGGIVGLGCVFLAYLAATREAKSFDSAGVLVIVTGVGNSILEGWFFAGGSMLFVLYWVALFSASKPTQSPVLRSNPHSAEGSRL